ncbi:hypothetical protein TRFO_10442 [Tritrichomonas foetus]|uniref:Uncharacterized protein n=1 Tax=Tritrichomonas foetus TaxID=1144522 RepID=A0A1J4J8T6_9EUKA|nr:hypothetical protein TRFO_10442 [Tritrichomonas foetus]|eukprot:OHS95552.1 hypothetical protein TRFO_10442 [Tritrichomonas foetus]
MHSDEELKDGRYFPSPKEQAILTQTIDQYFSLPERSEQRSIVVQNVTAKLAEINPRWTHRAVRLWFNNNKRTCLKTSVQFDPHQIHGTDVSADRMPLKKRPQRSPSVGSFITRPLSPPADITIADNLASVFTAISQQRQSLDEKKKLETDITSRLIEGSGRLWADHIAPIEQVHSITAPETMPDCHDPKSSQSPQYINEIIQRYNSIEAGILVNGIPAVIDFDSTEQKRTLFLNNENYPTACPFPASSLFFDDSTSTFFTAAGTKVFQIDKDGSLLPNVLIPGCPPMLRSSICATNEGIVLGSRRNIYFWNYQQLDRSSNLPQDHPNFSNSMDSGLQSVTSVISVNSMIAAASNNHHAIHIMNHEGRSVSTFIGHGAGVTCLNNSNKNDNLFISGSVDLTARLWDSRELTGPIVQIQRHYAPLSSVYLYSENNMPTLAFTGGEDHIVRIWDLRINRPLSEVHVGMGIPVAIDYNMQTRTMSVLTKEKSATIAEGFQILPADDTGRFIEKCLNLYIKYTFNQF